MTTTIGALPARVNLDIYQGDDLGFVLTVTGISLAGAVGSAQVRLHPSSTASVPFSVSIDEATGKISAVLTAADTAALTPGAQVWDLQVIIGGQVRTLVAGAANVVAEVTV